MSLFARIFILIAVTLLLVAGGELFNGLNLRQNRLEEVLSETKQLARIADLDMNSILEGTRQLLATLATLPTEHGWDQRACSIVEATANSDFEYDHLIAVDRSGIIRCSSTNGSKFLGAPMPDPELFNRIVATAGFSVGSYGVGRMSGNDVIRVGYPVVDGEGTVVGAVYAGVNVTWLNTAIDQWQLGETASIEIADRNGIVVARHPGSRAVGQPISDNLKPFVSMLGIGTAEVTGADGVVRIYGYVPVNADTSNGLAVFVGRDRDRIFADINRSIRLNGAVVLIGLLLSAAVAAFYIRRVLVRPLQSLLSVAGRWRDGDWTARTGAASGIPEFDRLSAGFDGMAAEVSIQIREREITEQTLAAGLERFRFIFESASDGIFVTDTQTHTFLDVNAAACAMFGYSQGELIGRTIEFLSTGIPPYGQHDVMASLEKGRSGGTQTFVWHCKAKDGHLFWAEISVRIVDLGGHEVAILRDITERKRQHEEVTRQAHFDTLTGLPNRLNFDGTLEQEITRSRRYDRPLCMAIADIDHFKLVNDTFGHQVGDAVLKHLAEFMHNSLRSTDYVARWGGEEFTILLPETNLDDAEELLNRLRVGISNHVIPEIGRAVTLSFGVTACTKPDSAEDLLKRADRALYTSKQTGRNKVIKLRRSAADAHSAPVPL